MAGRRRMSLRQPNVQGNKTRLCAETKYREEKERTGQRRCQLQPGKLIEVQRTGCAPQQGEKEEQKAVPMCVAIRYVHPASRPAAFSSSNVTRKKLVNAMISHPIRKSIPFREVTTRIMLPISRL